MYRKLVPGLMTLLILAGVSPAQAPFFLGTRTRSFLLGCHRTTGASQPSPLQIVRNYQQAASRLRGKVLFDPQRDAKR
jgi:hypothetical protein